MVCLVAGEVVLPSGEAVGRARIDFTPIPEVVSTTVDQTVAPSSVAAHADIYGQISVSLVAGSYRAVATPYGGKAYPEFTVTVPDSTSALLSNIIDLPPPPSLDAAELAVLSAQSARDSAIIAQTAAETAAQAAAGSATTAGNAEGGAVAANNAAQTAKTAAETAQGAAETAATAAAQAQTGAETAQAGAETAQTGAQGARADAIAAKDAAEAAQSSAESAQTAAVSAQNSAESAAIAAIAARDKAEAWAETPEDTEVEPAAFSALHHAQKSSASAAQAEIFAAGSELRGAVGTLSAVLGQVAREQPALAAKVDQAVADVGQTETDLLADMGSIGGAAFFAMRVASQVSRQINGGRADLTGGTLDDPALRIGTAGIYSSAADTLSIAIAGTEVARFTPSGLTIFGTVTEA